MVRAHLEGVVVAQQASHRLPHILLYHIQELVRLSNVVIFDLSIVLVNIHLEPCF